AFDRAIGHRRRYLAAGPVVHRGGVDRGGSRTDSRRAEVPGAGHAYQPDAALWLVRADRRGDDPLRLSAADCRRPAVRARAAARLAVLRCDAGRRPDPLAAPVLDLRAP